MRNTNQGVLEFFVVVDSIEVDATTLVEVRKVLGGCEVELLAHLVISTSKELVEDVEVSLESSLEGNSGLLCLFSVSMSQEEKKKKKRGNELITFSSK